MLSQRPRQKRTEQSLGQTIQGPQKTLHLNSRRTPESTLQTTLNQKEVTRGDQRLPATSSQPKQNSNPQRIQMSGFTASRHEMMKKIKTLLEKNKEEEHNEEINQIIDSLRSRIGATGKERINTINEYFRQIVNLSLPALHRYMMWSASEGKHLFSPD